MGVVAWQIKLPLRMLTSHVRGLVQVLSILLPIRLPANASWATAAEDSSLPPLWKTWMEFQAPDLAGPSPVYCRVWGRESADTRYLSLWHAAFKVNENK